MLKGGLQMSLFGNKHELEEASKRAKKKYYEKVARQVIKSLERKRMRGYYYDTCEDALSGIMKMIPEGCVVGMGGPLTLYQIGLVDALKKGNYHLLDVWEDGIEPGESWERRRKALTADVFISGSNALTLNGELVNIDGIGNRVSGMIFGPPKVIIVVGANKIVSNVEEGIRRIKLVAAPLLAQYYGRQTPCGITGICNECHSKEKMCHITVIIDGEHETWYPEVRTHVVVIGEELGF
jgi:L-lactate utilization protein LutB